MNTIGDVSAEFQYKTSLVLDLGTQGLMKHADKSWQDQFKNVRLQLNELSTLFKNEASRLILEGGGSHSPLGADYLGALRIIDEERAELGAKLITFGAEGEFGPPTPTAADMDYDRGVLAERERAAAAAAQATKPKPKAPNPAKKAQENAAAALAAAEAQKKALAEKAAKEQQQWLLIGGVGVLGLAVLASKRRR